MSEVLISKETGNQYRIIQRVGSGNYAEVFKGQNIKTKEIVAIKKMMQMRKADAQMAKKQIQLMKTLNHKNIVRFIDQFRQNGTWYIILEYCGKGDLDKYKQKVGKIPQYHCKILVRGILEALVELHTQKKQINKKKIAHRDLKLPNILINDQYQLKLADFGFSKDFEEGWMKSFCGTPLTMAPEVLRRDQYNEKCDVWSLGVITYFLLYNKYPYYPTKSDGPGVQGITNCVLKKPLNFDKATQVSDFGKDFLTKCLQKPLEKRPYSHQLLNHPWFNVDGRFSKLREDLISKSFQQTPEKQAILHCKVMLYGVVEDHIKKNYQKMLINQQRLKKNIEIFRQYYKYEDTILEYYLLIVLKRLDQFYKNSIIIILENRSIKIQANKIRKMVQLNRLLEQYISTQIQKLNSKRNSPVNIEKQLIKFLLNESEMLMEIENENQIQEKLSLLKDMTITVMKNYDNSIINVKWGQREDFNKFYKYIEIFIAQEKDEQILQIINEEIVNDDDLESIWLIQHQITETNKRNTNLEMQIGKSILYILDTPSNFIADKTYQSDIYQLDFTYIQ